MSAMPGGPLAGLQSSVSSILPSGGQGGGGGHKGPHPSLNPLQFGKFLGGGGEAAGAAAGGEAAAGGLAELAPLALAL